MYRLSSILTLLTLSVPLAAEPFVPEADSIVLERLPECYAVAPELRRLRAALARDPDDVAVATDLARRYLEIARREGDPRWNGYAQAVLAPWWERDDPPAGVLILRATLRQNRHDFDGALEDLARLLRADPRHAQAWLTRAVVLQVRGDYRGALESCRVVDRLRPSLLARACLANAASMTGEAEASYRFLDQAVRESTAATANDRVWSLTSLAEIAQRLGQNDLAERHYEEALGLGIRDVYLLAAYADFLLDRDRPAEVVELLEGETRSDALYLRLALAAARLDAADLEDHVRALEARFAASRRRGETTHLGSESRFVLHLLGQPHEALALALRNWRVQREPIDARLVLEAALAAGRHEAARPVVTWLEESGAQDVRLERLVRAFDQDEEVGP